MTNPPNKEKKKMGRGLKITLIVVGALLALCLIAGIVLFCMSRAGKEDLTKLPETDDPVPYNEIVTYNGHHYVYNTNMTAFALIGVDKRQLGVTNADANAIGMADVTVLFAVDQKSGKATLVTLPRDTVCEVDIYRNGSLHRTTRSQLCTAFSYGDGGALSCENTLRSMRRVLYGIPIQKYVCLDMDGIAPLGDALGGVTLTAQIDLPQYGIRTGDTVTLKGDMTEAYLRARGKEELDAAYERAERQQQYFAALGDSLRDTLKNDPASLPALYGTLTEYTLTDITLENVTALAGLMMGQGVTEFDSVTLAGSYTAEPIEDSDDVYALFTPDPDKLYQTVIDVFYLPLD